MEDELEQLTADYLSSVLGFNGERIDPVLGGYHLGNGYRLYSPSLRRFTSPDSMSPFGKGGINPYTYCEGDPINNTDPTGHWIITSLLGLVMMAIPGGAEAEEGEAIAGRLTRDVAERATEPGPSKDIGRPRRDSVKIRDGQIPLPSSSEMDNQLTDSMAYFDNSHTFSHTYEGNNIESHEIGRGSTFDNTYAREKWIFGYNRRNASSCYYASDIVKYQYRKISKLFNFYGTMPKLIERHAVINEHTTDLTDGLKDQELFDAFFQKTPNGKSTQRILDAFGLKATKVTRVRNNFLIEVE